VLKQISRNLKTLVSQPLRDLVLANEVSTMFVRLFTWPSLALVGVIGGGLCAPAQAAEGRLAGSLVQTCKAEQGDASGWCSAYLLGAADTLTAFGEGGKKGGLCGASYAIKDLPEVFPTWMQANSQFLELDMLASVSLVLRQTWPCR